MIQLRGYKARWFAGAGSLGYNGFDAGHPPLVRAWKWPFRFTGLLDPTKFAVVTKTITLTPRVGRQTDWGFRRYAWPVGHGRFRSMVNAVALTNPGIRAWVRRYYRQTVRRGICLVLSLHIEDIEEAKALGKICSELGDLAGVQINAGCPNLPHIAAGSSAEVSEFTRIVDAFQSWYTGPLLIKFRVGQLWWHMANDLAGRCAAYELINAVPYNEAQRLGLVHGPSPLDSYGYSGSVSGGLISHTALQELLLYRALGLKTPVISGGGVLTHYSTLNRYKLCSLYTETRTRLKGGSDAVSFATAFLWEPWGPNRVIRQIEEEEREAKRGGTERFHDPCVVGLPRPSASGNNDQAGC